MASQVVAVACRVEVAERQATATNRTVATHGAQLSALDLRLSTLEKEKDGPPQGGDNGFCGGPDPWRQYGRRVQTSAAAGHAASSGGGRPESVGSVSAFSPTGEENDLGRVMAEQFRLPIKRRRLVVLGGFLRNTERSIISAKLNEHSHSMLLAICPGDYNSKRKWLLSSNSAARKLMITMKGRKFSVEIGGEQFTLWHGFDKSIAEQTLARGTMLIHKGLKEHFISKGLGESVAEWRWWKDNLLDCDSDVGVVFVKTRATPELPATVHDITKNSKERSRSATTLRSA